MLSANIHFSFWADLLLATAQIIMIHSCFFKIMTLSNERYQKREMCKREKCQCCFNSFQLSVDLT